MKYYRTFEKHYMWVLAILGALRGVQIHGDILGCMVGLPFLGFVLVNSIKLLVSMVRSFVDWRDENPDTPITEMGGLTQYDRALAEAIGKAAADKIAKEVERLNEAKNK
jgi:hypothetical protein